MKPQKTYILLLSNNNEYSKLANQHLENIKIHPISRVGIAASIFLYGLMTT